MACSSKVEWERDDEYLIDDECKRRGIRNQRLRVTEEIQPKYIWEDVAKLKRISDKAKLRAFFN